MSRRQFTSWVRRGAAAGIVSPDPTTGPFTGAATFDPSITLSRNGILQPTVSVDGLPIIGPGSIVGIDLSLIVRTDPAPDAGDVEDNYLPLVEFARPDLPWLFTPASPGAKDRLRPWLVLIVVESAVALPQPGVPLPRIVVPDTELPDLNESWAWAHAQATADNEAQAREALKAPSGAAAISRLLCPRRLRDRRQYVACLVPATAGGKQAGLGETFDPASELLPAWTVGSGQSVRLPVYYWWTFSTGEAGDFESLVRRLEGVRTTQVKGFGTRRIDMSQPWRTVEGDAGLTIELEGALRTAAVGTRLPDGPRAVFETRLTAALEFPAEHDPTRADPERPQEEGSEPEPALSAVAPPIYGGRHAGQVRLPADGWLRTLNLDPARRIAASLGTRYAQEHQEFLMARAWEQVGAVREANRLRAAAELSSAVADRLHERHVEHFDPSEVVSFAAPARTRIPVDRSTTLSAQITKTPLARGAETVAFSRAARPHGPVGRRLFGRGRSSLIQESLQGTIVPAAPPRTLDGFLPPLMAATPTAGRSNATGLLSARSWGVIAENEMSLRLPDNFDELRRQVDAAAGTAGGGGPFSAPPGTLTPGVPRNPIQPFDLASNVKAELLPSRRIAFRIAGRVQVPASLAEQVTLMRVMAHPHFPAPLAMALAQGHAEWVLPGLGVFPEDRVTVLQTNPPFVEAFLAGVNHEFNNELLWREYPTDQRGTSFQHFWPRPDGRPDILPMTSWAGATELGANGPGDGEMVVLLARGEVLRRYPRTIVYAAPGRVEGARVTLDTAAEWIPPLFPLRLDARTTAFAFPLRPADLRSDISNARGGYYFVFSEPVTAPRFGFDQESTQPLRKWSDLNWRHVLEGSYPFARPRKSIAIPPDEPRPPEGEALYPAPQWDNDAADIARIAFAKPFRVVYHADVLLKGV